MDLDNKEQLLTRWIDGELAGDELREFEAAVAQDPQLAAAKTEAEELRNLLQAEIPAERDVPNPEFFNSQVQRRISASETPAPRATPTAGGILSWFRSPFTLASAAAVLILSLFAISQMGGGDVVPTDRTLVTSTYTPDPSIDAEHFYSDEADATVIMLDGLAALPDSTELKGQNVVSTEHGSPRKLYNENSELAFVIQQGADSVPIVHAF